MILYPIAEHINFISLIKLIVSVLSSSCHVYFSVQKIFALHPFICFFKNINACRKRSKSSLLDKSIRIIKSNTSYINDSVIFLLVLENFRFHLCLFYLLIFVIISSIIVCASMFCFCFNSV